MNRKRNVSYIKPEDPAFLKVLKKQAGYDDQNHKFDELENDEEDFVEDGDSEQPQVVVLKDGDLTAEEAERERKVIEKIESETKADLNERVIFKFGKNKSCKVDDVNRKRKTNPQQKSTKEKKNRSLLSFDDDNEDDNSDDN